MCNNKFWICIILYFPRWIRPFFCSEFFSFGFDWLIGFNSVLLQKLLNEASNYLNDNFALHF